MNARQDDKILSVCLIGSADFCRRTTALSNKSPHCASIVSGTIAEAWGLILTNRPNILIVEIGLHSNERTFEWTARLLQQARQRFANEIYVVLALTACERLSFAGDLLFANSNDMLPSGLIDAMVANPPPLLPSAAPLSEQLLGLFALTSIEFKRRTSGLPALPQLSDPNWIQSQADPSSRELWMRWIPRYASYINESPLIIGETGSGKTKVAHALHTLSGREGEFVSITPRDFSSSELVQAELFGAVAGAYTGAIDKWGLVKSAEKGTLFIDELQSIDKDLQGKLITFIENKFYRRVGSADRIEADVRFVFASNKSIEEMIALQILREDFAYRLERVQLNLQPLRVRRLDITAALAYALAKIHRQRPASTAIRGYSSAAYRLLYSHDWPGNLRQLENNVAQLCELADIKQQSLIDEISVLQLIGAKAETHTDNIQEIIAHAAYQVSQNALQGKVSSLQAGIDKFVENVRVAALESCAGDVDKAAQLLAESRAVLAFTASTVKLRKDLEPIL